MVGVRQRYCEYYGKSAIENSDCESKEQRWRHFYQFSKVNIFVSSKMNSVKNSSYIDSSKKFMQRKVECTYLVCRAFMTTSSNMMYPAQVELSASVSILRRRSPCGTEVKCPSEISLRFLLAG